MGGRHGPRAWEPGPRGTYQTRTSGWRMLRFRHTRLCIDATAHTRRTRLDAALAHDPVWRRLGRATHDDGLPAIDHVQAVAAGRADARRSSTIGIWFFQVFIAPRALK